MLLEGQHLDRYHILHLLGSGGMGDVYLAEDPRIGQQVAIKVIRTEPGAYPHANAPMKAAHLFYREAKAIVKLDHPHILPLFDYGEERIGDLLVIYLVMPYRPEGSLAKWLSQRTQQELLSPRDVAHLVHQAAAALQHAHDRQLIHQDVKPSNFLIRERKEIPGRPDLLLADFGIARLITATSVASQTVHGTPTYMAPEQCLGHAVPASDQYALAIMTYELLTGRPPFLGGPVQVMFQHLHETPQPPGSLNASLSKEVDEVLLRALSKQPSERFVSISAFAAAFEGAVQHLPQADYALPAPPTLSLLNAPLSGEMRADLAISEAEARMGTTRVVTLPGGQTLHVQVPAGVQDGDIVRIDSQGSLSTDERETNILWLTIRIKQGNGAFLASSLLAQSTALLPKTNVPPSSTVIVPQQDQPTINLPDSEPVRPAVTPLTPVHLIASPGASTEGAASHEAPTEVATAGIPAGARRPRRPRWFLFALPALALLLITGGIVVALVNPFRVGSNPSVIVTITPVSKHLANTYTITAVTTPPNASLHQVAARVISASTSPSSQTVPATGTTTSPATHASGILTLYNYSTTASVTLAAGTNLPNQQSTPVDMILDGSVTVPAASDPTNPPTGNVAAHVAQVGAIGNLPPVNTGNAGFYYCTNCSGSTVRGYEIENDSAFSGGRDTQTVTTVQQSDINGAAISLETSNAPNPQQALQGQVHPGEQLLGTPECRPKETSDHQSGDQASSVTVTVTFTCTGEVYDRDAALSLAAKLLSDQAATELGRGYSLVGRVATVLTQASVTNTAQGAITVTIAAHGTWAFQLSASLKQMLTTLIAGKTQQQARSFLLVQAGVQQVTIQASGGENTLPTDVHQISIVVQAVS